MPTLRNTLSEIKIWSEFIFTVLSPFVFTIWAWGWPWFFATFALLCLVAWKIGGNEVHGNIFFGVCMLYLAVPTFALITICGPHPNLWYLPYVYFVICGLLSVRRDSFYFPP
jgi:hypothetical protein